MEWEKWKEARIGWIRRNEIWNMLKATWKEVFTNGLVFHLSRHQKKQFKQSFKKKNIEFCKSLLS